MWVILKIEIKKQNGIKSTTKGHGQCFSQLLTACRLSAYNALKMFLFVQLDKALKSDKGNIAVKSGTVKAILCPFCLSVGYDFI